MSNELHISALSDWQKEAILNRTPKTELLNLIDLVITRYGLPMYQKARGSTMHQLPTISIATSIDDWAELYRLENSLYYRSEARLHQISLRYAPKKVVKAVCARMGILPHVDRLPDKTDLSIKLGARLIYLDGGKLTNDDEKWQRAVDLPIAKMKGINIYDTDKADNDFMDEVAQDFINEIPPSLCTGQTIGIDYYSISLENCIVSFLFKANFCIDKDFTDVLERLNRDDISLGQIMYHALNENELKISVIMHFGDLRKRRKGGY